MVAPSRAEPALRPADSERRRMWRHGASIVVMHPQCDNGRAGGPMNERFAEEVKATLQRGVALPSPLTPKDGHPHVEQVDTGTVVVDWRMPDGSVSLLESGLAACEMILR